jgi:PKD repeat protein
MVIVYYNGAIVAGAVATGCATVDLSNVPNLQYCYGDQLKIVATNLDASTRTIIISVLGTQIYRPSAGVSAPTADFSGSPLLACLNQAVTFTDLSTGVPTSWLWAFGDGGASALQNPSHAYLAAGSYDVNLRSANDDGYDNESKAAYVVVMAYESFAAGWVEQDIAGKITKTSNYMWTVAAMPNNAAAYTYSDKGAGYFVNAIIACRVYYTALTGSMRTGLIAIGNGVGGYESYTNGRIGVEFVNAAGVYYLRLRYQRIDGNETDSGPAALNTAYYLWLYNDPVAGTATLKYYTDESMTNLVDTLVVTNAALIGMDFRYLFCVGSANEADADTASGNVSNITIVSH